MILTDEEIVDINDKYYNIAFRNFEADNAIARAIEAAVLDKLAGDVEPVAWVYDWYADDGCGISEAVTDWVTRNYEEAHSPTNGCHNIRPLVPASALAAAQQEVDRLKQTNEVLRRDIANPPSDVQEWVLNKYEFHRAVAERDAEQAKVRELVKVLVDAKYALEGARIWGGMDWTYNPLHPFKYLPVRDKISAAIAKHGGQT